MRQLVGQGLKRLPWKLVFFLVLVTVFSLTYAVAYFAVSESPYGHYIESTLYSAQKPTSNESATIEGAWQNKMISLAPAAGSTEVSRDVEILVVDPIPVNVENITLSPNMPFKIFVQRLQPYSSSGTIYIHPAKLLQPNTTYNISAMVAGTPSWWTFTTSAEPSKYTIYSSSLLNAVPPSAAITLTFIAFAVVSQRRKKILFA